MPRGPVRTCPICGWAIVGFDEGFDKPVSWLNEFRGLYSCPDGIVLTGVGILSSRNPGAFIAPPDPSARWGDLGYSSPPEDQFGVMTQTGVNRRCGYAFHDACWSFLERQFQPVPVPVKRVFEVCDSVPWIMIAWVGHILHWGHDYGGVGVIGHQDRFPWEPHFEYRGFPHSWVDNPNSPNPLAVSEVDKILTASKLLEGPSWDQRTVTGSAQLSANDLFDSLPMELRLDIAARLPMSDVLNARRALRSFGPLFHSQQFWADRFKETAERSWLFETQDTKGVRDWRRLYRATAVSHLPPGLRNRQRIWPLVEQVAAIVKLRWSDPPSPLLSLWKLKSDDGMDWALAAGRHAEEPEDFSPLEKGCRRLHTIKVAIPSDVCTLSASTVRFGRSEYIAGISLATAAGQVLHLGYKGPDERHVRLSGLAGFNVAVGLGGIHALQCINGGTMEPTVWLGCPDNAPKTERLAVGSRITALEVEFDSFRMVSIAVAYEPAMPRTFPQQLQLRRSAIWYPDVPPSNLNINDDDFQPLRAYTWGFKPLFWSRFGGPGGSYLAHLTKLTIKSSRALFRIDFTFDTPVPAECQQFGRHEEPGYGEPLEFKIDGPGGEVIDKVEFGQGFAENDVYAGGWMQTEGYLEWVKLSTNRGRVCEISPAIPRENKRILPRTISATPGTAITGFYGAQYRNLGCSISTFGVITEPLGPTNSESS